MALWLARVVDEGRNLEISKPMRNLFCVKEFIAKYLGMRSWNLFNKYLAFILRLSIVLLYFWNILSLNLIRRNNKLEYALNIFLKGQVVIRLIKKNLE